jgi:hypothetical protein
LYTSCVLGLRPSALFNDMTLFIKKKKRIVSMIFMNLHQHIYF